MKKKKTNVLQGSLDLLVLQSLRNRALHGYAITRHLAEVSEDFFADRRGILVPRAPPNGKTRLDQIAMGYERIQSSGKVLRIDVSWSSTIEGRSCTLAKDFQSGRSGIGIQRESCLGTIMSWLSYPTSFSSSSLRTLSEIDNDIDDEIEFHIQSRIEDLRAEGMSYQQAETAARAAFGSQASIRSQCQRINYGNRIWLTRLAIVAIAVCLISITTLAYQLASERSRNNQLLVQLQQATAEFTNVDGEVVDQQGKPIVGANVRIVVKTWPNGNFNQQLFTTTTDENGKFNYRGLLPNRKNYAVNVAIFKSGFVFASQYDTKLGDSANRFQTLRFQLQHSENVRMQFRFISTDEPVANTGVCLLSRFDGMQEHLTYEFGDGPAAMTTDASGILEIPFVLLNNELDLQFATSGISNEPVTVRAGEDTICYIESSHLESSY